jgi:hypothetical protein
MAGNNTSTRCIATGPRRQTPRRWHEAACLLALSSAPLRLPRRRNHDLTTHNAAIEPRRQRRDLAPATTGVGAGRPRRACGAGHHRGGGPGRAHPGPPGRRRDLHPGRDAERLDLAVRAPEWREGVPPDRRAGPARDRARPRPSTPGATTVATPGPTIEMVEGETVRIYVTNKLPEPTTVHWHGLILPSRHGRRRGPQPGRPSRRRDLQVRVRAAEPGTFMYHPHFDEMTQMALGMVGMIVVHPRQAGHGRRATSR